MILTEELRDLLKRCDFDSTVAGELDRVVESIEQERAQTAALLNECGFVFKDNMLHSRADTGDFAVYQWVAKRCKNDTGQ